jgi:hypothetical protein
LAEILRVAQDGKIAGTTYVAWRRSKALEKIHAALSFCAADYSTTCHPVNLKAQVLDVVGWPRFSRY